MTPSLITYPSHVCINAHPHLWLMRISPLEPVLQHVQQYLRCGRSIHHEYVHLLVRLVLMQRTPHAYVWLYVVQLLRPLAIILPGHV